MSKTIDEKIVEMRLENSNFEKNAANSIGTLAKLKQSLNLTGASKGLEQVNAAAGKVNMGGLGSAVESVSLKFSALQVMGVTALANITNSAVNAAKNFVTVLTVAPVSDGFQEYEMTLNAVQTTMAGTGKTAKEVEKELKKLDEYADKTVYSTSDMLNNLPKFTNAGVELESSTKAMIGIANATALAGGDAGKASIAFYNLGQAIGTGYLTRMDYNSINNAGIATMEWKNQMVNAALAAGTLTQAGEDLYTANGKNFSLQQLFIDGLQEQWATTDVMMKVFGDYGDETTEIGKKSYAAAQDVKTFTMMMDSLKATAGTGWKDTWQIIFGGLDEAKELWSGLNNFISNIITSMSDIRNEILEKALGGNPFGAMAERISTLTAPAEKAAAAVNNTISTIANLDEIANKVINGDYKNTDTGRRQNLMAEGYNWAVVQNRVNEMLGSTTRHSEEAAEAELQMYKAEHGLVETGKKVNETRSIAIDQLGNMTDAELTALGLNEDEIESLRELAKMCKMAGISMSEFLANPGILNGRNLLINAFKNIGEGITEFATTAKRAWQAIFPPKTIDERAAQLYKLIAVFHKLTKPFKNLIDDSGELTETGDKLARTFKGIFAVISIVTDIVGGGLKLAFKLVTTILGYFNIDILDLTAAVGDALVKFRAMTDVSKVFAKALDFIVPMLKNAVTAVKGWIDAFRKIPQVENAINNIKNAFAKLKEMDFKELGGHIMDGLKNGIGAKTIEVVKKIIEVGTNLIIGFCETLGICSPSKEFFAAGQFIIEGLVNGLKAGASTVWETIKSIGQGCIDFFSKIDWGALFAIGVSAGMVYFVKKMADAFEMLAGPIDGITDILKSCAKVTDRVALVVKNFAKLEKAVAFNIQMDGIKTLALSIAILAGTIIVLTFIDPSKLWNAVLIVGALAAILAALAVAMQLLSTASDSFSISKEGVKFEGFKTIILTVAASLLVVAAAVKLIGSMDPEEAVRGFGGLIGVIIAIGAVIKIYDTIVSGKSAQNVARASSTMLKLTGALLILAVVAKIMSRMTWDEIGKAVGGITSLVGIIALLMMVSTIQNKKVKHLGSMLLQIAGAIAILTIVAKLIAHMSWGDMGKAAVGLLGLTGIVAALVGITQLVGGKSLDKVGRTILAISIAMGALVIVGKLISTMSWGDMGKAAIGLLGLSGIIGILVAIVGKAHDAPKIAGTLLAMSVAIGILGAVAIMLSLISWEGIAKGVVAIGGLSLFMALLVRSTEKATDCKGNLIAMAAAIAVMALAVAALSLIDGSKLAGAVVAIDAVMAAFALMIYATKGAKDCLGNLIVMTVAVAIIGAVLYTLAHLDPASAVGSAIALSVLMLAMSGALVIASAAGKFAKDAFIGILALLAMAVPLIAFVGVLAVMQFVDKATENAYALTTLATALSLMLIPLTIVGVVAAATAGISALGIVALLAMAIPLLALVGVLAVMQYVKDAEANAVLLTDLMNAMCDLLIKISIVAPLAVLGMSAMSHLTVFMVAIGALAVGIGALIDKFPAIETFIDKGIPILAKLAGGIGLIVGSLIGGFTAGLATALPVLAIQLSLFMNLIQPFLAGARQIDSSVLEGVGILTAAILLLTVAKFIEGITSLLPTSASFALLAMDLSMFMVAIQPFLDGATYIDPVIVDGVKTLAEVILILTAAKLLDGISKWIAGGSSISDLGKQLIPFGMSMVAFSRIVSGRIDSAAVTAAANAGKVMAEMADTIPNSGGLAGIFAGNNDISTFGAQLIAFGGAMVGFSEIVAGRIDETAVSAAAAAGATMVELANTVPNSGGVWSMFAGDNDLTTFGIQIAAFGTAMVGFSAIVAGNIDQDAVDAAAKAGGVMVELANTIPNTGGVFEVFTGTNNMVTFGAQIAAFGAGLAAYSLEVEGIDVEAVSASAKAATELAKIQNDLGKTGGLISLFTGDNNLTSFGANLITFGGSMLAYSEIVDDIDTDDLEDATESFKALVEMSKSAENVDFKGIDAFAKALKSLAKNGVDDFVLEFEDGQDEVEEAGEDLIGAAADGIESKEGSFKRAAKKTVQAGVDGVYNKKKSFKSAGKDLGAGLVEGIKETKEAVYAAGYELGQTAVAGEKDGQKSHSPSKLTMQAGRWIGEGLIIGMQRMGRAVYNAGQSLGEGTTDSIAATISRIGELINSDIESQPTIRPVLDLSEVSAGAGAISGMLDTNPSIGLMSNIRSISSMSGSRQNGNDDVVSAIDKLGKALSNLPSGDNISINGITYDDGSNINDAVRSIVRAARMERRA